MTGSKKNSPRPTNSTASNCFPRQPLGGFITEPLPPGAFTLGPPEKCLFTAEELCGIIKACGEAQVVELKLGDLYVRFGQQPVPEAPANEVQSPAPTPEAAISATQNELEKEAERALTQDEVKLREDQLDMALLENPLLYEELIAKGEVEDDGDDEE